MEKSELQIIGETKYLRKDRPEVNLRHYFEISPQKPPDYWAHVVHSFGCDNGLVYDFFWPEILEAKGIYRKIRRALTLKISLN